MIEATKRCKDEAISYSILTCCAVVNSIVFIPKNSIGYPFCFVKIERFLISNLLEPNFSLFFLENCVSLHPKNLQKIP